MSPQHLAVALVAISLAVGCKEEPSVESITAENRDAIVSLIERVAAVRGQLASAPSEHNGFEAAAGITTANTIVIAEQDFDALRTDLFENEVLDRYNWQPGTAVRPFSTYDLGTLVDAVRSPPRNPPSRSESGLAVIRRALELVPRTRFVAVARTDQAQSTTVAGSTFTGASWRGHIAVWDLEGGRWVGSVPIRVDDERTETSVGRAVTSASGQLNRRFNTTITDSIRRAIETGAAIHGARE